MSAVEHRYEVTDRQERWSGRIFTVVTDEVTMPGGGTAPRDYVKHVGAVAGLSGRSVIGRALPASLRIDAASAALDRYES